MKSNNYNIEANSNCQTLYHLYVITVLNWRFDPIHTTNMSLRIWSTKVTNVGRYPYVIDFLKHWITNYDIAYMCFGASFVNERHDLHTIFTMITWKDSSANLEDFPTRSRFPFAVNLRHDRSQPIVCSGLIGSSTSKTVENPRVLRDVRKIAATSVLKLQTIVSHNIFPQDIIRPR